MKVCPVCHNSKPLRDTCDVCESSGVVCDATAEYYQLREAITAPGDNRIKNYGINLFLAKPIPPQ